LSRVALDTSAYSAFERGHPEVVEHLRRARELLLPCVLLGELLAGFEASDRPRRNREELRLFLDSPRVRRVPLGEATAERYARIYASLRGAGRPLPTNALWIAASAMEPGAELVTLDRTSVMWPRSSSRSTSRDGSRTSQGEAPRRRLVGPVRFELAPPEPDSERSPCN
jgi:tRNA(fMet)-specific endonuclease VapC